MKSKSVKRMLSFVAAAAMVLTLLPAIPAKAADSASPESDFTWDGTKITGYKGNGGDVVIPEKTTEIAKKVFYDNDKITSVTLNAQLQAIGSLAFADCNGIKKVTIKGHLIKDTGYYEKPFSGDDALATVEFTDTELASVPGAIFRQAYGITTVSIPDSVTTIGEGAFEECSKLKISKLPESIQQIGAKAFRGCKSITEVTLPKNVTTLGLEAFGECSITKVTITGHSIKDIGYYDRPFRYNSGLTTVEFTDAELKNIPGGIFHDVTALNKVSMPDSVTTIGESAFDGCSSLNEISIPNSLTSLGNDAFNGCSSLAEISLPVSFTTLGDSVFKGCTSLTSLKFNNNTKGSLSYRSLEYGDDPLPTDAQNLTVYGYNGAGVDTLVAKHNEKNDIKISYSSLGAAVSPEYKSTGRPFTNPNDTTGASYEWRTRIADGADVAFKNGEVDKNEFISDGTYTYYVQNDGTVMKDRLTYHPDGQHVIFFDANGHEVFNTFTHASKSIEGNAIADGEQYYFNVYGYMYVNTVTYDATGTKLYYINPYGKLEHNGWFSFDPNAGYGDDPNAKWSFTGSYVGFANYDGTLLYDAATFDYNGTPCYMQGNGEAKY